MTDPEKAWYARLDARRKHTQRVLAAACGAGPWSATRCTACGLAFPVPAPGNLPPCPMCGGTPENCLQGGGGRGTAEAAIRGAHELGVEWEG